MIEIEPAKTVKMINPPIDQADNKPFHCDECGKGFQDKGNMNKHKRIHSGEKPYACKDCGKRFSQTSHLNRHKIVHSDARPFQCECGRTFVEKSVFISHKKTHFSEKSFKSEDGDKTIIDYSERPFKCTECEKSFYHVSNLNIHQRIHSGEKPFKCEECGKGFTLISGLKTHEVIHTGEKPFQCEECGKKFNFSTNLNNHMRTHFKEHQFKCEECGKLYSNLRNFKAHQREHSGEFLYKCDECGKGFNLMTSFKCHKATHSEEKPFACDQCDKKFRRMSQLSSHKIIHSGEKRYKCEECGESFARLPQLKIHKKKHSSETLKVKQEDEKLKHSFKNDSILGDGFVKIEPDALRYDSVLSDGFIKTEPEVFETNNDYMTDFPLMNSNKIKIETPESSFDNSFSQQSDLNAHEEEQLSETLKVDQEDEINKHPFDNSFKNDSILGDGFVKIEPDAFRGDSFVSYGFIKTDPEVLESNDYTMNLPTNIKMETPESSFDNSFSQLSDLNAHSSERSYVEGKNLLKVEKEDKNPFEDSFRSDSFPNHGFIKTETGFESNEDYTTDLPLMDPNNIKIEAPETTY